jgi:hypothetical protein
LIKAFEMFSLSVISHTQQVKHVRPQPHARICKKPSSWRGMAIPYRNSRVLGCDGRGNLSNAVISALVRHRIASTSRPNGPAIWAITAHPTPRLPSRIRTSYAQDSASVRLSTVSASIAVSIKASTVGGPLASVTKRQRPLRFRS